LLTSFDFPQPWKGWPVFALDMTMRKLPLAALFCAIAALTVSPSRAQQATEIRLTYSGGQFQPAQVSAPADKPITFRVKNADAKAMEFESKSLRVEKVVAAGTEGVINVRALKPGRYEFYDDFNDKARGALIVQ
jgi:heme/copper-type cytochrome/quinol oxidase subunit 2